MWLTTSLWLLFREGREEGGKGEGKEEGSNLVDFTRASKITPQNLIGHVVWSLFYVFVGGVTA